MSDNEQSPGLPPERTWKMWLIMRSRPLVLALVLLVTIIVMLLTGAGEDVNPR